MSAVTNPIPSAAALRQLFDTPAAPTVGLEEEVMLLHPDTLDLLPRATDVLSRTTRDGWLKDELPASQLELVTPPAKTVAETAATLRDARRQLVLTAQGIGLVAAAGAHPFAAPEGILNTAARYRRMIEEYGWAARRQLLFGLHVHVAIRPADRAVGVYNALRAYLPELAALGANAPFYAGADTGLQSIRPKLADVLPRQGIPPALSGMDELAAALNWAARAGVLSTPRQWWWELRLHPLLGTIEVRVLDAQTTVHETAALAAVTQALCVWLGRRHDADDLPPPAPSWRIVENRWSACRHSVHGYLADLSTGRPVPARERLETLLADLAPVARELGCVAELASARRLIEAPAPDRQREIAAERGLRGLVAWLAEAFVD
jgi:glutamate---cysteine ligase / carboxylate-amine ligase